jgi:hypothetical protein
MTPEKVVEGKDGAGLEPSGESRGSNDLALNGGTAATVAGDVSLEVGQGEPSLNIDDAVSTELVKQAPEVFKQAVDELTESYDQAMRMHNHYVDQAINGTNIDMMGSPSDDAKDYLAAAINASANKVQLMKGLMNMLSSRSKGKAQGGGPSADVKIGPGGTANFFSVSHRDRLAEIDRASGGSADGKMSASKVIDIKPDEGTER